MLLHVDIQTLQNKFLFELLKIGLHFCRFLLLGSQLGWWTKLAASCFLLCVRTLFFSSLKWLFVYMAWRKITKSEITCTDIIHWNDSEPSPCCSCILSRGRSFFLQYFIRISLFIYLGLIKQAWHTPIMFKLHFNSFFSLLHQYQDIVSEDSSIFGILSLVGLVVWFLICSVMYSLYSSRIFRSIWPTLTTGFGDFILSGGWSYSLAYNVRGMQSSLI